jgi:hypothetical protein
VYSQDTIEKEKRAIIMEFLLSDEFRAISESFFERQIQNVKQSHPELSDSVWDDVRANVDAKTAFLDTVVESYQSKLSIDELKEIKGLYDTPIMLKMKKVTTEVGESFPMMAAECGRKIMNKINDYLGSNSSKTKK